MDLMWLPASFTPEEVYNIYKLMCIPVIFWGNHIYYGIDFIITYLVVIKWYPTFMYMIKTVLFSFFKWFLPLSPGDQLIYQWINYRFKCIKHQTKPCIFLFIFPWKLSVRIIKSFSKVLVQLLPAQVLTDVYKLITFAKTY